MIRKALTIYICLKGVLSAVTEPTLLGNTTFLATGQDLRAADMESNHPSILSTNANPNTELVFPKQVKAPYYVILQEEETIIVVYNQFFKLFDSYGREVECDITSDWPSKRQYPYENVTNEDKKWGLKIEGSRIPNFGKMNVFDEIVYLKIGNRTYGSMRFLLYIFKVVPHAHYYFQTNNYNPLKPWNFYVPENSNFDLPIDKNIYGENVQVSLGTQPNSTLTNHFIHNKTDYTYISFEGDISQILTELSS